MKKVGSNFKNKFHLLYTQESLEKIIWSSSDSSDYESVYHKENVINRKLTPNPRKRKRRCGKNNLKNVSNLDVVYTENKETNNTRKSPIIEIKSKPCSSTKVTKQHSSSAKVTEKSPIVSIPRELISNKTIKSPILMSKTISSIQSPKVRKRLFDSKERHLQKVKEESHTMIPQQNIEKEFFTHIKSDNSSLRPMKESLVQNNRPVNKNAETESVDLAKRIKTYFQNHFNSQASSQNSISEYESTPHSNSKTDEIDTISLTDDNEKSNMEMTSSKDSSLDLDDTKLSKTLKLKKDGLAYQLNSLLKKQNANISLWQNEQFLAYSSKFSIPKGESTVFQIRNVQLKYGCYLLDVVDVDNNTFSIIINILHVNNVNLEANAVLKLYKPYECLNINNRNVIVNVFKFECDNSFKPK